MLCVAIHFSILMWWRIKSKSLFEVLKGQTSPSLSPRTMRGYESHVSNIQGKVKYSFTFAIFSDKGNI